MAAPTLSAPPTGPPEDGWKHTGVRVIPKESLDSATAQTPGMSRAAAINFDRVGAQHIWAGTVTIEANAKTGAHHHGHLESVIYVLKGRARLRWGEKLEYVAEAGPGDFIFVPPYVPHQEINALEDEKLECVLMRSDGEAIAVNLPDLEVAEKPEGIAWIDPTHKWLPAGLTIVKPGEEGGDHSHEHGNHTHTHERGPDHSHLHTHTH